MQGAGLPGEVKATKDTTTGPDHGVVSTGLIGDSESGIEVAGEINKIWACKSCS